MSTPFFIQIKGEDNVAIAVEDIAAGTQVMPGVTTREDIPQAHKLALTDIPKGGEIIRYGVVLGYAKDSIPVGAWINEHMLELPQSPGLEDMPYGTNLVPPEKLPDPPRTTWLGYRNAHGPAGTRNLLGIVTTVQCAAGVVNVAVERIRKELLSKYPNVDGVVVANHPYGCGVAIKAREAHIPIRAVTNLIRHPNFGGELMVVGLGCEKLTYDMVLPPEDITLENTLTLQDYAGHDAMMDALMAMAEKKLQRLNLRHREELPLSELLIGMQCGGDVTVLFEYVSADDLRWSLLAGAVCDRIEAGKHGWLVLPLDGSVPSLYGEEGLLCGEGVSEEERAALCTTHTVVTSTYYAEPLPLFNRVVIFGGGHITQALTPMLGTVDFRCVVLDNRPAFADISLFKGAEDAIVCDYDNIAESVTLTAEDLSLIHI